MQHRKRSVSRIGRAWKSRHDNEADAPDTHAGRCPKPGCSPLGRNKYPTPLIHAEPPVGALPATRIRRLQTPNSVKRRGRGVRR
jgi:hypothetical protein